MPLDDRQLENSPGALLTVDEAAQRLSIEPQEVEDMIRNKTLPAITDGGEPMINVAQLDYYTSTEISKTVHLGGSNEEIDTL
jgi:excisionase family DNA binding protein